MSEDTDKKTAGRLLRILSPGSADAPAPSADPAPRRARRIPFARSGGGVWEGAYWTCYLTGRLVSRILRRLWQLLAALLRTLGRWIRGLWDKTGGRALALAGREWRRLKAGFPLARQRLREAREKSLWLALLTALLLPFTALRRHRRALGLLWQTGALAAAVLLMIGVIRYWRSTTFALELVYGGDPIGYITDEAVFTDAVNMAESRVIKTEAAYVIRRESDMSLRAVQQSRVLDRDQLCDEILRRSGGQVERMCGLYINGVFEGALPSHSEMQRMLDAILAKYDVETDTTEKTAEFMGLVEAVDGLYPVDAKEDYWQLYSRLTRRDARGIPYLPVQIRCTEVYEESIPYGKVTYKDASKYIGYSAVATRGEAGVLRITADVVYLNGVEQYREITDETVTKKPVDEVTVIGSYRVNTQAVAGVPTGHFMWPLPSCHTVWSPFGMRWGKLHKGIDISGGGVYGKDILAADGGVVKQINTEGWGWGYGLFVLIDHGNGYQTMYAHCSQVLVEVGQQVTQGQLIARVGSTGDSQGPHLHFEIRLDGEPVDPVPYVK